MTDEQPLDFKARLAQLRAEKGIVEEPVEQKATLIPVSTENSDLVPDVYERTESDQLIEDTIKRIGILAAYRKWIGKEVAENETNLVEGCHVSCPQPGHRDSHPSAWINQEKNLFHCPLCEKGGDVYDLASIGFGYNERPDGAEFHRLREAMAESFGTHVKHVAGGTIAWRDDTPHQTPPEQPSAPAPLQTVAPVDQPVNVLMEDKVPADVVDPAPVGATPPVVTAADYFAQQLAPAAPEATVTQLHAVPVNYEDEGSEQIILYPSLDWRTIVPENTFLYEYLTATSHDDSPEEYHFWHGMLALGHTVGKHVQIDDQPPVNANLLLCLLGGTGFGKSKSRRYMKQVLETVAPFKSEDDRTTGVKVVPVPGSGEYLVHLFQHQTRDPSTGKPTNQYNSVNGIVDFDEFSGLLARVKRQGSTLGPMVMQFADCDPRVTIGSMTQGETYAVDPFCSITASTQPRAVRALLTKQDQSSGFLNRWVFAGGPRKEREVFGGSHSHIQVDLSRAIDQLKLVKGWGGATDRLITIDPAAMPEIISFFKTKIEPLMDKDETDMLKRLNLIYKKVLLLLAINSHKQVIDLDIHRRAMPIIDYLVQNYLLVSANIGITAQHEISNDILRHMERHLANYGKGASARDLSRYMATKNYTPGQLKQALDYLVGLDLIEIEPKQPGPGRPTVRYRKVEVG